ncbi:MAG: efflux RND transporter periplasmic adaptor subunit, partial [Deltaproteobacteria bacterium]|nr:efflux RND transporter periplasmic adaptor subunit [Deltaproteobacteria bacterium]
EERTRLAEEKKAALKAEVPAVRVITLTLEPHRLVDKINLPAEVEPRDDLWVRAEVAGQVVKVLVKAGQTVKKGNVLVQLDDRDYRSRLARIEAAYRLAKLEYDRIAALAEKKVTAKAQLDSVEAQVKDLAAQLSEAQRALGRTAIRAPIGGRLNEVAVNKGDLVGVGQPVAQILQFGRVKVTVGLPESDVAAVFDLTEAEVIIEALDGRRVEGRKIFLSRQPRTLARLYDLELSVPNPDGHILPGMFARVEVVKKVFEDALAVPLYAVITQGEEKFVFVERDGIAQKRVVELGILVGWQVQVTTGLFPGERVVIVGQRFLDDGQAVEVVRTVTRPEEIIEP